MDEPKILQVTYGAFSCTLEGFEDPVETLMAVAEYFRGLAASDPGFAGVGAMPDATEMARQVRAAGAGPVEVRVEATAEAPPEGDDGEWTPEGAPDEEEATPIAQSDRRDEDVASKRIEAAGAGPVEVRVEAPAEPPPEGDVGDATAEAAPDEAEVAPIPQATRRDEDGASKRFMPVETSGADRLAAGLAALRRARLAGLGPDGADGPERAVVVAPIATEPDEVAEPEPLVAKQNGSATREPLVAERDDLADLEPPGAEQDGSADPEPIGPSQAQGDERAPASGPGPSAESEGPAERKERDAEAVDASREARRLLATSPDEDALLRILSRAESQLADPEAARRREALAHIKAAVAATEASRTMGDVPSDAEEASPFREDLEAVVRSPVPPVRPAAPPLRLVASQRVDLPRMKAALSGKRPPAPEGRPATESPAPPMARPSSDDLSPRPALSGGGSFGDFAGTAGAAALPDLLEAAAVWISRTEGQESASRGQLLELVQGVLGREPGREDSLRLIGTLLREGRLARVGNGRFRPGPLSRLDPARLAG